MVLPHGARRGAAWRLRRGVTVAALGIPLAVAACGGGPSGSPGGTTAGIEPVTGRSPATVVLETDRLTFEPARVTVAVGAVVAWDNPGDIPHNVVFDPPNGLASDLLPHGSRYEVRVSRAGTYDYTCTLHPGMDGVIVATAGSPGPAPASPAASP